MTAFDMVQQVYSAEPCARTFQEDLALHFRYGYVFSQPDAFICGRPVDRNAPKEEIVCPWITFQHPDCWLVYLAAGTKALAVFLQHEPFNLPYFCWERDNRLRFYTRTQVIRHVTRTIPRGDTILQGRGSAQAPAATGPASPIHCR